MNYKKIYEYRFKDVKKDRKITVWKEIGKLIFRLLDKPEKIYDPCCGMFEFINNIDAKEKFASDENIDLLKHFANKEVKIVNTPPDNFFDAAFVSNYLEHLPTSDDICVFLKNMHSCLKENGKIVIMGPNFKYSYREYFDFADHVSILTHLSVCEYLYSVGFKIEKVYPKFLPISFRSKYPVNKFLVRFYLKFPIFYSLFGKQFLIIAKK